MDQAAPDNFGNQNETVDIVIDPVSNPQETLPPVQPEQPQTQEISTSNQQETPVVAENTPQSILPEQPEPKEEVKEKHAGGRPCEYCKRSDEINKIAIAYLESAREAKKNKKAFIPYQQELADILDIDNDTLYQWTIKIKEGTQELEHEEFTGLIKKLNTIKELLLLKRTTGRYNPTGAIFQLKTKHGYIESEKRILAGDTKEPLEIIITEERKIPGE